MPGRFSGIARATQSKAFRAAESERAGPATAVANASVRLKREARHDPRRTRRSHWGVAEKLRDSVSTAHYKHLVPGLIFLNYAFYQFYIQTQLILIRVAETGSDDYVLVLSARR